MATDKDFADFICGQLENAGEIICKKMFGEYAIYCNGKVTALICDNQLYIKPTESGRKFIGDIIEAPPYAGAKDYFLIGEQFEDSDWLSELFFVTAKELPEPKKKNKK